jgi:membrane-associated phospholipid phosphatase
VTSVSVLHPRGVLAIAVACFLALTAAVVALGALPADAALRDAVLAVAAPGVVAVMRLVNRAGDWRVLAPGMVVFFVVFRRARERWWPWLVVMGLAPILEWTLKHLVGRSRPEDVSLGFPSGHSTAAATFFGMVMLMAGDLPGWACAAVRALALVVILLVGVARVMLRAHWPSDVLAGIALGLALAAAAGWIASPSRPTEEA